MNVKTDFLNKSNINPKNLFILLVSDIVLLINVAISAYIFGGGAFRKILHILAVDRPTDTGQLELSCNLSRKFPKFP